VLGFTYFTLAFYYANIELTPRMYTPTFFLLLNAGAAAFFVVDKDAKTGWFTPFLGIFVGVAVVLNLVQSVAFAPSAKAGGLGYNSVAWRHSPTIAAVKALPESVKIHTNGHDVIPFLTGKKATMLPAKFFAGTNQPNESYEAQILSVCRTVADSEAVIVYFLPSWRTYLPTQQELEATCALPVLARFNDGIIYGNPPKTR